MLRRYIIVAMLLDISCRLQITPAYIELPRRGQRFHRLPLIRHRRAFDG